MKNIDQIPALTTKEKDVLVQIPQTISRTFKKHLEMLTEPFSVPNELNAKIKRVFSKPQ